jgi:hypothetical protein
MSAYKYSHITNYTKKITIQSPTHHQNVLTNSLSLLKNPSHRNKLSTTAKTTVTESKTTLTTSIHHKFILISSQKTEFNNYCTRLIQTKGRFSEKVSSLNLHLRNSSKTLLKTSLRSRRIW